MKLSKEFREAMEAAARGPAPEPEPPVADATPDPEVEEVDDSSPTPVFDMDGELDKAIAKHMKPLSERAVLIRLKRSMFSTSKLDEEETEAYGAGNVHKHLFKGRDNRVREAMSRYTDVYRAVNRAGPPWMENGWRVLKIEEYQDTAAEIRGLTTLARAAVNDMLDNWDYEVEKDLRRLEEIAQQKGKPNLARREDYPSKEEMERKFNIEVLFAPVPDVSGFPGAISQEDRDALKKTFKETEDRFAGWMIKEMLAPMQAAAAKLGTTIGEDGSKFRNSLVGNLVEVAERMARINMSPDPELRESINDLRSLVAQYANNIDVLRKSPAVRQKAKDQIDSLIERMSGLV